MSSPAVEVPSASTLVIRTSATGATTTGALLVLLARFGSGVVLPNHGGVGKDARHGRGDAHGQRQHALLANSQVAQRTQHQIVAGVHSGGAVSSVTPAGNTSVTSTLLASDGPALRTISV